MNAVSIEIICSQGSSMTYRALDICQSEEAWVAHHQFNVLFISAAVVGRDESVLNQKARVEAATQRRLRTCKINPIIQPRRRSVVEDRVKVGPWPAEGHIVGETACGLEPPPSLHILRFSQFGE
jgi:hypothetical protein